MAEPEQATDFFGNPLTDGCYIVYGTLLGRCAAIKVGKVRSVQWKRQPYGNEHWSIRVTSVERGWKGEYERCRKDGTLNYPERSIVVAKSQLPMKVLTLLENA